MFSETANEHSANGLNAWVDHLADIGIPIVRYVPKKTFVKFYAPTFLFLIFNYFNFTCVFFPRFSINTAYDNGWGWTTDDHNFDPGCLWAGIK